ncbi:hypothetical protein GF323_01480 [Candidatus Woesearchaeota archaeon]|nr:hypothetical protein [Candidatus Woesearchaeota archaeon]
MIKNRARKISIGITLAIIIPLLAFYMEGESMDKGMTGYAVHENKETFSHVIISGTEIKAVVEGKTYWYIYNDKGWFESKDFIEWEKREDMGSLWQGLYYLKTYDAEIYYDNEKVGDITELAGKLG